MYRRCLAILAIFALAFGMLLIRSEVCRTHGAEEGHGGGGAHSGAVGYRSGYCGYYGRYGRYGYWGHPWCYGVGLGLGIGCGWGYPYCYYDGCSPVYVDTGYYGPGLSGGTPNGYAPSGVASPNGLLPPGQVAAGGIGPAPRVQLTDADVLFSVRVPNDAVVWFNGFRTTQMGLRREFMSSGLAPGRTYSFEIRAQWTGQDGKVVDLNRRISVQGGERRAVDFMAPLPPSSNSSQ
jgi:uncharacterized protein (TIGR03000 family)